MKHLAYLNASPDGSKKSRAEVCRQVARKSPDMPDTVGGEHLIEYMLTIGPGMAGAMGYVPLDFAEIAAWDSINLLNMHERKIIRDLSRTYIAQSNISTKASCLAPWERGVADMEAHNMLKSMSDISEASKGSKPLSKHKAKRGK